jgi:nucleotide-binding universal stress UspA family protein
MQVNRILAAAGLNPSAKTLEAAISLAIKFDSELVAISVVDDLLVEAEKYVYPLGNDDLIEQNSMLVQLNSLVYKLAAKLDYKRPVTTLAVVGNREHTILSEIEKRKIQLLVIGHRSEWRIEHWLFGKAFDHIVNKSSCAVLVVPEPE